MVPTDVVAPRFSFKQGSRERLSTSPTRTYRRSELKALELRKVSRSSARQEEPEQQVILRQPGALSYAANMPADNTKPRCYGCNIVCVEPRHLARLPYFTRCTISQQTFASGLDYIHLPLPWIYYDQFEGILEMSGRFLRV